MKPNELDVIWESTLATLHRIERNKNHRSKKIDEANKIVLKTLEIIDYFKPKYSFHRKPSNWTFGKKQEFMNGLPYFDVDYCKYGLHDRKRTRVWTNCETWTPRELCKKDCGNVVDGKHVETAQRMPSGKKEQWGDNPKFHPQKDLYIIPSTLFLLFLL